jgi:natural product biosynthesis luciferase-like monooxygenase protein
MQISLFYFADDAGGSEPGYRLLLEGAQLADRLGLTAVWTPERHFSGFGGRYANPAVTGAAVAAVTSRIGVRAGSVAVPLHHIVRVAEEWAMVDQLSGGRAGLSLAPGGAMADFVLNPGAYPERKRLVTDAVERLRSFWRAEPYRTDAMEPGGRYTVTPAPVRGTLPLWLTTAGDPATFRAAGAARTGVLTHLMRQTLPELRERVSLYRRTLAESGSSWPGHVTLMVHTHVDVSAERARQQARGPLERYLVAAMGLLRPEAGTDGGRKARLAVRTAAGRYLGEDGLIGSVASLRPAVDRFREAGVDELACLVDFGLPVDAVLESVSRLGELAAGSRPQPVAGNARISSTARRK